MEKAGKLCGALRRNGKDRCRKFAGERTSHPGIGPCYLHLGNSRNHNKAAIKRELQKRMVEEATLGIVEAAEITAKDAILQELAYSTAQVAWLRTQIAAMPPEELGTPYGITITRMYDAERQKKTDVARAAIQSGVDEAHIRVLSQQVTLLGQALAAAAETAGLTEPAKRRLGEALRQELALVNTPGLPA